MLYNESSELFTELSNSDTEIISGGKGRKNRFDNHGNITGYGGDATNNGTINGNGNGGVVLAGGDGVVIDQS
jgi:hypothetical protein